jgi:7,8-dihydropterin-6-yl-methyl-4-(beta-D-ribofuranosyl)aminobenzene 5'-phosphate synthase
MKTNNSIIIVTLYDGYEYDSKLRTGFGFSCLVKIGGKSLLFDTGSESQTLLYNMQQLKIKPEEVEIVVLSHSHGDHTGGLRGFLNANGHKAKVYEPGVFKKPTEIGTNVYSTGGLGRFIKEQALAVKSLRGLIVITGCAHPGVVNIVKKAQEIEKTIYIVLGGFHLGDGRAVIKEFKALGVQKVAPCHCTGDLAIGQFREEYKDNFIANGVGKIIEI